MALVKLLAGSREWEITEDTILGEEFTMEDGICSEQELKYGGCICKCITVKCLDMSIFNKIQYGESVEIDYHDESIGVLYVYSKELDDNKKAFTLVLYDALFKALNTDVSDWWYGLGSYDSVTMGYAWKNLLADLGLNYDAISLPCDNVPIPAPSSDKKSIVIARDILKPMAEMNGRFLKSTKGYNKIEWLKLDGNANTILYPSTSIYPTGAGGGQPLYPTKDTQITADEYIDIKWSDYVTKRMTDVKVDISSGAILYHGVSGEMNCYTIARNILTENMVPSLAYAIANYFYQYVYSFVYQPVSELIIPHDPNIDVGDMIQVLTVDDESVRTVVLNKTTKGVYSSTDTIESNGVIIYK